MAPKPKRFDMQGSLHQAAYTLLKTDKRSLGEISTESGMSFYWVNRFHQNAFKNPSVNRVQFLYEFLSGKKLKV